MTKKKNMKIRERELGFSAIEMLISVALITLVLGVALAAMRDMQARNFAEGSRVDTVQETRDFIDQVVRDVHVAGYPSSRVLNQPLGSCTGNANIACGIISFSPLQVTYEGDLDGTGTIRQIYLNLVQGPGGACPCILQRGVVLKTIPPSPVTYFTEVNGVLNSGNGAGASTFGAALGGPGNYAAYTTADVFSAYQLDGTQVTVACGVPVPNPAACSNIRSLQITANVAPTFMDPNTKIFPVVSITSKARLNNNSF